MSLRNVLAAPVLMTFGLVVGLVVATLLSLGVAVADGDDAGLIVGAVLAGFLGGGGAVAGLAVAMFTKS